MPDPKWENLKDIFHTALALPRQQRADYRKHACTGNASLKKEVEALLKSHEGTNNFIDTPAYQAAAEMLAGDAELKPDPTICWAPPPWLTVSRCKHSHCDYTRDPQNK